MSRNTKIISIMCILLMLLGMNATVPKGYANTEESGSADSSEEATENSSEEKADEPAPVVDIKGSTIEEMKMVASTETLELYFNEETADFAIKEKRNGKVWYSNPADREKDTFAAAENKGLLSSQVVLNYFNPNGQTSRMDSYRDSVMKEQFVFEKVDNGIKIVYTIGNAEKGIEQIPVKMSKERFHTLILDKIKDEKTKKDFQKRFKYIKEEDVYERRDGAFSKVAINRAVQLFAEVGYTEEDLAQDNVEHGGEVGETQNFPMFVIPIIVQLDGDSVTVNIKGSEIDYNEQFPINTIQILPFFGAAGKDETGYMLVPDGSGALIELNNGKNHYQPYSARVYGKDEAVLEKTDQLTSEDIKLPIFGMKQGDYAFFSIIEEGDGIASIEADVSGRLNSYNSVYSTFVLKNSGEITLSGGNRSNTTFVFQKGEYKENITIRYAFLNGDQANYTGMANYYQKYLIDKYQLEPLEQEDNIPFYLDLTGSIWKRKTILGIPYKSLEPLTTFEEGKKIVNELMDEDIKNLKVRYTGWFNEGVNHKIPTSVNVDSKIGGKKGLEGFAQFLSENNVDFYPDVAFTNVYRNTIGFSPSRDASRYITKKIAQIYPTNLATYRQDIQNRTPYYLLSPAKLPNYVDEFIKDYEKFNINGLSLRDIGSMHSDYREKKVINREQSKKAMEEQMNKLKGKFTNLLTIGGNAPELPYAKSILEVPLSSSNFNITDKSIPFYQMVIHGYIDYAGKPVNLNDDQYIRNQILKALETGSNVYFSWFYKDPSVIKETEFNHLISSNYHLWLDESINMYNEVNSVLKDVRNKAITSHKELAEGVYETTYGNDYSIIVNYNGEAVTVDNRIIEPESYIIGRGE
ncbi:DUF5696 domain-containing protein [Lederbergia wuyishanensis]|uniref:Uncharacterized protein n=1 Tax=Lederbergia wuyishanensis TaxID=1347903 RepID=A0ABU0DA38_9BACI|nr:DUF5696 domain-containing protein [Lederbergia wuyishanensis]MCJ8009942.1 DUF5696 domain-containing protein [Lederbergia wuyishanensis]MDQ0345289.1 hypothetical protein [Lederbergia wuyishanensis]